MPIQYTEFNTWCWLGEDSAKLASRPRTINEDAKQVFISGQCHSLAVALNRLTGWKLYGMYTDDDINEYGEKTDSPDHVIVRTPYGFADIGGLGVDERYSRRTSRHFHLLPITEEEIESWEEPRHSTWGRYHPLQTEDAMPYAKLLLKRINKAVKEGR